MPGDVCVDPGDVLVQVSTKSVGRSVSSALVGEEVAVERREGGADREDRRLVTGGGDVVLSCEGGGYIGPRGVIAYAQPQGLAL